MNIVWPHFQNPLALRLAETLLHFLWQGVAWAALLWLWLQVFGHRGAAHRHLVCLFVLAGMFTSPFVTFLTISTPTALAIIEPSPASLARAVTAGERIPLGLSSATVTRENLGSLLAESGRPRRESWTCCTSPDPTSSSYGVLGYSSSRCVSRPDTSAR
jgi:hypothetical protein